MMWGGRAAGSWWWQKCRRCSSALLMCWAALPSRSRSGRRSLLQMGGLGWLDAEGLQDCGFVLCLCAVVRID